jgi:hypothetical protein
MISENIRVTDQKLGTVMADISSGRIRIPRFQRNFVWGKSKILELLDSMYRGYPIGSIFLWLAPTKYNDLFRKIDGLEQPLPNEYAGSSFVLDGQQRLISLFVTIRGLVFGREDYSNIAFDLHDKKFVYKQNANNIRYVRVCDLLHSTNHLKIYNALEDEHKLSFDNCRTILTSYPLSIVTVYDQSLEGVVTIFQRINKSGKELTSYDLVCANLWTEEFDLRERVKSDLINYFRDKNFGELSERNIAQGIAMCLSPVADASSETQLRLVSEAVQENWGKYVESYRLAVDFVRQNLGVERASFIPYEAMLPVLASYYFRNNNKAPASVAHKEFLCEWFWRVSFSERYSVSTETRMTEDGILLRTLLEETKVPNLNHIRVILDETTVITASMTRKSALRNGVCCLLAQKRPLHFVNGSEINTADDYFSDYTAAEKHHIFPQAFLKRLGHEKKLHSLPNFCFIPAELNKKLSDTEPSVYFNQVSDQNFNFVNIMKTHFIPVDEKSGVWNDDYELFIKQRASLLLQEIYRLCHAKFVIFPEERQVVIDLLEDELRDRIDMILKQESEDYWQHLVPVDIKTQVKTRIDQEIEANPSRKIAEYDSARKKLTYCNIMDYYKIIAQKTVRRHFESTFRPERDVEAYFRSFSDYRNAVFHNREIDNLLASRGQTAIIWLSNALDLDFTDLTGY